MSLRSDITRLVESTPIADTHEHIMEEKLRLEPADGSRLDDFAVLFSHYSDSDLRVAGMPGKDLERAMTRGVPWEEKWKLIKPHYQASRNTGYMQAVRITVQKLYGEPDITDATVERINEKAHGLVKPGFIGHVIKEVAHIDHCQVNSLERKVFCETDHPDFLLQDIGTPPLVAGWGDRDLWQMGGVGEVKSIQDYHKVIDGIFARFAPKAVSTKNQMNYSRRLDYANVKADDIASVFERSLAGDQKLIPQENKAVQDHLFHYCIVKANEYKLPVKLHCGYYAGQNGMPLHILRYNGGDMCDLLKLHRDTPYVFMHINYPYENELIAVCKHYTNAYADMCWAWIINPGAGVRFLKEFLMAAPANKILTFGGDYRMVEAVVGHAAIARHGIAQALAELVEEGWMPEGDVGYVARRIMVENARELFRIHDKFGL